MKISNQISFFIAFLGVLFFTSCNKEEGSVTPNVLRRLDKMTEPSGDTEEYTYDTKGNLVGRLTKLKFSSSIYTSNDTYTYNGNTIIATNSAVPSKPNEPIDITTYKLNAQGLAVNIVRQYGSGPNFSMQEIEYNSGGFPIKIIFKEKYTQAATYKIWDEATFVYDAYGDLLSKKYIGIGTEIKYEYDRTHYNTVGNKFKGQEWLGENSLHALSKATWSYSTGRKEEYIYENKYDSKGYMTNQVPVSNGTSYPYSYTYK